MQRMGQVIKVRGEYLDEYKKLHAAVWPDVLAVISRAKLQNYTIVLKEPENLLFAYWEYVGVDYEADMRQLGEDEAMRRWWVITDPMQEPFENRAPQKWWAEMPAVFHLA